MQARGEMTKRENREEGELKSGSAGFAGSDADVRENRLVSTVKKRSLPASAARSWHSFQSVMFAKPALW